MKKVRLGICLVSILAATTAFAGGGEPKIIGKGDPLLREFVSLHASSAGKKQGQVASKLYNTAKAEWAPTLRAILDRPLPVANYSKGNESSVKAHEDELFWRRGASDVLGKLRDKDAIEPLLRNTLAGTGSATALAAIGPAAVERVGKFLLDPRDPLRSVTRWDGRLPEERDILQSFAQLLGSTGSAEVRDALIQYGNQSQEPCLVASIVAQLPRSDAAVAFFKQAYLRSLPCSIEQAVGWGDPALLAWGQAQNKAFRMPEGTLSATAVAIGQLGDSNETDAAMSDVTTHGNPDQLATMQDYLAQAKRCELDAGCYVKLANAEFKLRDRHGFLVLKKAVSMIVRTHDQNAADALLSDSKLKGVIFSPLAEPVMALATPATVRAFVSQPQMDTQFRLSREMAAVSGMWKDQLAAGAVVVPDNPRFVAALPSGECDLRKADWKNGRYAEAAHGVAFQLKDGVAGENSLEHVDYGDMDGDGKVEAIVDLANRPAYTGGGGKYTIGSNVQLLFDSRGCKAHFLGVLPSGTKTFKGTHLAVDGVANYKFHLAGGQLAVMAAGAQTARPAGACTKDCVFNAACDPISRNGVFGACCDAVGGDLKFAAECRRRRGE